MKIIITAREALDRDIWRLLCDIKGINPWAMNEGLMDSTEEISLTEKEAESLNLMNSRKDNELL